MEREGVIMSRLMRLSLAFIFIISAVPASTVAAQPELPANCVTGIHANGAVYLICMPPAWNGDLVIYAHGYVAAGEPVAIPWDQLVLPDGTAIPEIINGLGYAFATTSYSLNGLAIIQGVAEVTDLVSVFGAIAGDPNHTYLVGASEGGLITTLAVEQRPDVFAGGVAACGPIGDFRKQINYLGDFRVVFDYFFPGVLPGSPVDIPAEVMENWDTLYAPQVLQAIQSKPGKTQQLLRVTRAPTDPFDRMTIMDTVEGVLWYNVFATNDGVAKLGGQPFDNLTRWYWGSKNDFRLNRKVARFGADPAAQAELESRYQTSGVLASPLVSLHTTGDPIVPYWHATLYRLKALAGGSRRQHTNIPILRYGHCNFKVSEVLVAFSLMVLKSSGQPLDNTMDVLPDQASRLEFQNLAEEFGVRP
jgi:pimeloyl-ACP methyl ester carboxylesterase